MQTVCAGDTRGDRRCNHDSTHRVCAKIGEADTSFWMFTGQKSWCVHLSARFCVPTRTRMHTVLLIYLEPRAYMPLPRSVRSLPRLGNRCNTVGYYGGEFGSQMRCPADKPTWCICKWATASWIKGESCNERVEIDCAATDICATAQGLFFSYNDYDTNLHPARECTKSKCSAQWAKCKAANPKNGSKEV